MDVFKALLDKKVVNHECKVNTCFQVAFVYFEMVICWSVRHTACRQLSSNMTCHPAITFFFKQGPNSDQHFDSYIHSNIIPQLIK